MRIPSKLFVGMRISKRQTIFSCSLLWGFWLPSGFSLFSLHPSRALLSSFSSFSFAVGRSLLVFGAHRPTLLRVISVWHFLRKN
jgi:hypothetical protein